MRLTDVLLIAGATARLSRLVTTDFIGAWWIKDPVDRAMERYEESHPGEPEPWWWKYRAGLDCPYCVGFWIGTGVLASYAVAGRSRFWRFGAGALALNYVVAHVSSRIDTAHTEEKS